MDKSAKIPKLQGQSNYEIWSLRMESVLIEKGFRSVMAGEKRETPEGLVVQDEESFKALAYIRLALADGPLLQIRHIKTPQECWNTLKELYSAKGFSAEFILCKELFETTLAGCQNSMEQYLNNIKRLKDDLEAKDLKIPDRLILAWVLNNLSEAYESFVSITIQSLRTQTALSLETLFSSLIDESKRLDSKDSNQTLLSNSKTSNKNKKKCSFCEKTGHKEDKCWKKDPSKNPFKTKQADKESDSEDLLMACQTIKSSDWVLDSGATSHICCDINLFRDLKTTSKSIQWGKAGTIFASGIGSVLRSGIRAEGLGSGLLLDRVPSAYNKFSLYFVYFSFLFSTLCLVYLARYYLQIIYSLYVRLMS